jgi:hypothetical protein
MADNSRTISDVASRNPKPSDRALRCHCVSFGSSFTLVSTAHQRGIDCDENMTPMDTPMKVKDKVSSFLYLHNDNTKNWLLSNSCIISNILRNNGDDDRDWICHEQDWLKMQVYQSWTFGSLATRHYLIGKATTIQSEFEIHEHFMESLFHKLSNGSSWPQDHISKASKPSWQIAFVCAKSGVRMWPRRPFYYRLLLDPEMDSNLTWIGPPT